MRNELLGKPSCKRSKLGLEAVFILALELFWNIPHFQMPVPSSPIAGCHFLFAEWDIQVNLLSWNV
jgi:hypothetical protein